MANHNEYHYEPSRSTQALPQFSNRRPSSDVAGTDEDDLTIDIDEPPDTYIQFGRRPTPSILPFTDGHGRIRLPNPPVDRKQSLLTQALHTSPDLIPVSNRELPTLSNLPRTRSAASTYSTTSATSTAELTSDGGLTSPARTTTPSPPLPSTNPTGLAIITPKGLSDLDISQDIKEPHLANTVTTSSDVQDLHHGTMEAGLGRKRCITFACGRRNTPQDKPTIPPQPEKLPTAEPPKRQYMLRFACPSKPSQEVSNVAAKVSKVSLSSPPASSTKATPLQSPSIRQHRDSDSTVKTATITLIKEPRRSRKSPAPSPEQRRSGSVKFHEFASSVDQDDAWIHEQQAPRRKITVNDTLRKENAIRRLGEEVEEEALEEENDAAGESDEDLDDNRDDIEIDLSSDTEDASDGGNETDNEEGFAESDEESDVDSQYQFWTTGLTTAATSTEQLDHIRSRLQRSASESSIESIINSTTVQTNHADTHQNLRKTRRQKRSLKMRPGTPDLPDSTDFVCGTLDEDRPLEAAYISCLEQRRIAKHPLIPQDFDPSFPTSDPEDDEDEDDFAEVSDEPLWVTGRPDDSDGESQRSRRNDNGKDVKSRRPSPKRLRSPPPPKRGRNPRSPLPPLLIKRGVSNRSPPPRRLFGQSPRRLPRSVAPQIRNLKSPPSSRRPSISQSPKQDAAAITMPHLAQRYNLTHTKSLPKTPNPFWRDHRQAQNDPSNQSEIGDSHRPRVRHGSDLHSRGPIDIVQGLENKRQRRKEKFWRQHCRTACKEKERRCQPGKGAQRMRELGLEMAGKGRGTGLKAQLVLSI
ncbi:hypothetical protein MMC24_002496 [Lignoscripta atroalba]|nr:hypothetical protein [Lignoscripta atroalba]